MKTPGLAAISSHVFSRKEVKSISLFGLFLFFALLSQAQNTVATLNFTDGTQDKRIVSRQKLLGDNQVQLESGQVIDLAKLKSIEMGVRNFEVKRVLVDLAQNQEEEPSLLPELYTPNIRDSLMILEKFVGGKITFYTTPMEGNTFYFVEKEGKSIVELRAYLTKRADGAVLRFDVFRNTLKALTADCPQVTAELVRNTRLFLKSLRQLVVTYNQACGFENYIAKKEKAKLIVNPGVFAGYALSSVDFNVSHQFQFHKSFVSGSAVQSGYPVGLNLKIPIGISLEKVWIETTHTVSHIAGSGKSVDTQTNPMYSRWYYETTFSFEANYFRNSIGLNFAITKNEKFKPFIGAGIGINACTSFNSSMHLSGYITDSAGNHPVPEESASALESY